ncbi:MAG TPA: DUF6134 family protein [Gemmataceae bacterium]|jgi:hypothetical protein
MIQKFPNTWSLLACAATVLLSAGGIRAADSETREFVVKVDGKPSGYANMTIQRQEDGTTIVSCDTNVRVRVLIKTYIYTCRTRETWKDGRLQQLVSQCNDDGKQFQVSAAAQGDGIHVRVNGREHITKSEAWVSSYWTLPDAKLRDQVIPVVDADNGRDFQGRLQFVGEAQMTIGGEAQNVQHYRFNGPNRIELYYDASQRLVRQDWVEDGHPTALELSRVRH